MNVLASALMLAMMTASIATTVAESALFRPVRARVCRLGSLPGKLISCGYCLSHWLAPPLVLFYWPKLLESPRDAVLICFAVIFQACMLWALMVGLMKWAGK